MSSHWAAQYIDRQTPILWKLGAEGPDAFDCWTFVRHVWHAHAHVEVPAVEVVPEVAGALSSAARIAHAQLFKNHDERTNWKETDDPQEFDAVLMSVNKHPHHVGVWAEADGGGILHCLEGSGVCFQNLASLTAHRWKVLGFYRHRSFT